ncbi:5-oxoprolinase/urea amidolyase family protein, partial [Klebsiella variicola]|uniref:5-oxoprolinase/urea amidolyase family protein n=1 Tax=Klebsiella variicola TaxID=244366 RepID=UPI001BD5C9EC
AKAIVWRPSRDEAIAGLAQALAETRLYGVETNRLYLKQILGFAPFTAGEPWTRCLEQLRYRADTVEVLSAGTQTSVQDYPGRLGYWAVGVPPSGPMDDRALRLGNRLLGNAEGDAALEITLSGPTLKFNTAVQAVICGAPLTVTLDGAGQDMNCVFTIPAGATLRLGAINGPGVRSYLCLRGGIQVPDYLGSKSTFTLGQFGGHGGRALRAGDVLHLAPLVETGEGAALPAGLRTALTDVRTLRVIYGPHGAPEFFAPAYMATFFATDWEVHFNSSRTGVRLIGPKPVWTRDSGGEAGLHPSNIHDNPYAVGAVDFTGDMPVILGPDGPSLGGFVCPVTVIEADLWQLGQLKAGDKVRFVAVDVPTARRLAAGRRAELATLQAQDVAWQPVPLTSPVVMTCGDADKRLVARLSGDTHLLLEAGEAELDLVLRFRIHALMQALEGQAREGIIDITPGIRSLQLHFQPETLALETLLAWVSGEWATVCMSDDLQVPTRVVHLPLSWDDPACRKAIDKYMTTVRPDAPWCPSNLEFIRRINDLPDEQAVWNTVFDASYLVMGLGDVYLGAPVATPLDPRHRLVTTKYNPARTWTAENSVGIGGAYLCVYGMEGPGGYQFVGRTLQMWNRYHEVADFAGKPWLLRFFDQLCFYPVSADELLEIRRDFPLGRYPLRIEHSTLRLAEYQQFLAREAQSIDAFRDHQQRAFNAERDRWIASGQAHFDSQESAAEEAGDAPLQPGEQGVESPVSGNLWQVQTEAGRLVRAGDVLVVLESMKMEIPLLAPCDGRVQQVNVQPGSAVRAGQRVAVIIEEKA